jgi:hypothetical protein
MRMVPRTQLHCEVFIVIGSVLAVHTGAGQYIAKRSYKQTTRLQKRGYVEWERMERLCVEQVV